MTSDSDTTATNAHIIVYSGSATAANVVVVNGTTTVTIEASGLYRISNYVEKILRKTVKRIAYKYPVFQPSYSKSHIPDLPIVPKVSRRLDRLLDNKQTFSNKQRFYKQTLSQ